MIAVLCGRPSRGQALKTVAAAISLSWNVIRVNKKKKIIDMAVQKKLPVIEWQAVQYLLDEQ